MKEFRAFLSLLLVVILCACASPQAQQRMESDMGEIKRRLANLENRTSGIGEEGMLGTMDRIAELGRQLAETRAALDALRVEFSSVNGRLADQDITIQNMRNELAVVREDLTLRIEALELRLAEVTAGPSTSQTAPAAKQPAQTAEELYMSNLALVREGKDMAAARKGFQEFLRKYPDHTLAVNAAYWIGETYYGEKQYKNAILQFQDVIDEHPKHPKLPSAYLKQGLAFKALGDDENARLLLEKVISSYPKSPEATKAKEKLR